MPGSTPPTSQLDWLISMTAMIVLFWSRATRDLLKSFGWGIGALHRLDAATKLPFPRRPPHSISRSLSRWPRLILGEEKEPEVDPRGRERRRSFPPGDQRVESRFLQQRVRCEPDPRERIPSVACRVTSWRCWRSSPRGRHGPAGRSTPAPSCCPSGRPWPPRGSCGRTAQRARPPSSPHSSARAARQRRLLNFFLPIEQPSTPLGPQLNVFPRIGVGGRHGREHVLPSCGGNAGADRLHRGMPKYRDEIVVVEDLALDFLGQSLAFAAIRGSEVSGELRIELGHAVAVFAVEAAAAHV